MRAVVLLSSVLLSATVAAAPLDVSVVAVNGRASLVFAAPAVHSPSVTSTAPTVLVVTAQTSGGCRPARFTAAPGDSHGVRAVTVRCDAGGTLLATVTLTRELRGVLRPGRDRLYLDLSAATISRDRRPAASPAGPSADAARRLSARLSSSDTLVSRAQSLAEQGRVRELQQLIEKADAMDRSEESREAMNSLLQVARQRRLELDRRLFADGQVR
jgi:hypothetical protein